MLRIIQNDTRSKLKNIQASSSSAKSYETDRQRTKVLLIIVCTQPLQTNIQVKVIRFKANKQLIESA
jgi:hypothetical protein